jgi:2-polyprenyl-6-methoxyphenol hydroxylase-like FAD-dependent oxidoreductase
MFLPLIRRYPAGLRARRHYAGLGDLAQRALDQCPEADQVYYDQVAQTHPPRWSAGRAALIGDAAAAVSLIAGQGASLGVAGAYVLAERLQRASTVPDGIAAYERRWRPVVSDVRRAARNRITEWFLPRSPARLLLRRWGFRAMHLPGLDRLMVGPLFPKGSGPVADLAA